MPRLSGLTLLMVVLSSVVPGCWAMAEDDSLSLGYEHTCVIASGGWLKCRGTHPLQVGKLPDDVTERRIKAFVSKSRSYCATYTTGSHACWGEGIPYREFGPELGFVDMAVGDSHSCARLDGNRGVTCWGESNDKGLLGGPCSAGENCNNPRADRVVNLGSDVIRVRQVAIGSNFTCALVDERSGDGHVKCWGQLGWESIEKYGDSIGDDASEMGDALHPLEREVTDADPAGSPARMPVHARKIAVGYQFGCALLDEGRPDGAGRVYCWGKEDERRVSGSARLQNLALDVAVGSGHVCAVVLGESPDQAIRCWGRNDKCQLGWGRSTEGVAGCDSDPPGSEGAELRPVELPEVRARPIALHAGDQHTCARMSDGSIFCWGANSNRQIVADGSIEYVAGPAVRPF